jgi:hypothetical protein
VRPPWGGWQETPSAIDPLLGQFWHIATCWPVCGDGSLLVPIFVAADEETGDIWAVRDEAGSARCRVVQSAVERVAVFIYSGKAGSDAYALCSGSTRRVERKRSTGRWP